MMPKKARKSRSWRYYGRWKREREWTYAARWGSASDLLSLERQDILGVEVTSCELRRLGRRSDD